VSQSLLYHAFGVQEGYEYVRNEYHQGVVEFHLSVSDRLLICQHCQARELIRKGKRLRRLEAAPKGAKPIWLVTEVPRCQCRGCGRVFEAASLALAHVHYTEQLSRNVVALSRRMTLADLSALTGLDWDTVKEIVQNNSNTTMTNCGSTR
jgi:hypothetical protein